MKKEISVESEELYQKIGDIDDDLILEAMHAVPVQNEKKRYRYVPTAILAAALFLVLLFRFYPKPVYWNTQSLTALSKESTANTVALELSYEKLLSYYQLSALPDQLLSLSRIENESYFILQDENGDVRNDENIVFYQDEDTFVSLTLSKKIFFSSDIKFSKIKNMEVALSSLNGKKCEAIFKKGEVYFSLSSSSLSKKDFLSLLSELLSFLS